VIRFGKSLPFRPPSIIDLISNQYDVEMQACHAMCRFRKAQSRIFIFPVHYRPAG
jgi:hypothetical protein